MTIVSPAIMDTNFTGPQAFGELKLPLMQLMNDSLSSIFSTTQTGNYSLTLLDRGTRIRYNSISNGTFTILTNAVVPLDVGTIIVFCQVGAGQLTIANSAGVSLLYPSLLSTMSTRTQTSTISIIQDLTDVWIGTGDMS